MADLLSELELFEQELKELGEDVSQTSTSENSKKLQDMPSNSQNSFSLHPPLNPPPPPPSVKIQTQAVPTFVQQNQYYPQGPADFQAAISIGSPPTLPPPPSLVQPPKQTVFAAPPVRNVPEDEEEEYEEEEDAPIGPEPPPLPRPPSDGSQKFLLPKRKRPVARKAAGQTWEDPTLAEWPDNDHRLFCGDLGNEVNDEVLTKAFSKYGSFNMAKVIRDKRTGKTRGFGFVSFSDQVDLSKALKEMSGKYVGNRPIKLRKSTWAERNDTNAKKAKGWVQAKRQKKHVLHN